MAGQGSTGPALDPQLSEAPDVLPWDTKWGNNRQDYPPHHLSLSSSLLMTVYSQGTLV